MEHLSHECAEILYSGLIEVNHMKCTFVNFCVTGWENITNITQRTMYHRAFRNFVIKDTLSLKARANRFFLPNNAESSANSFTYFLQ